MRIENNFTVDQPPDEAWRTLLNIPAIVPCMPGASLLETENERTFKGQVKLKLGPVAVAFQGRAQFVEIDNARHSARVKASGNETKGRGNAQADVEFKLAPDGGGTRVQVVTDVNLAGAVAQYGRAQGVIAGVAQVLVDQFAENLRQQLAADAAAPGSATPEAAADQGSVARPTPPNPTPPNKAPDVKGISVLSLIIAYIRGLFGWQPKGNAP